MRILLVTSFFPPTHTAGTEKRTLGYAVSLQKLGHDVQVVCVGKWDEGDRYWNGYVDEIHQQIPVRRIQLNWTLAPNPNQFLYYNPIVEEYLGNWLTQWKPDIVHITSCLTLSASVIQSAKDKNIPVVLTLTDFWFICPRVNLLKGDGSLCDGQTTAWDCLKCKLWDAGIYHGLSSIFPENINEKILTWASQHPNINRVRGLRGMALDMEHRKAYLSKMLQMADCITAPSTLLGDIINANGLHQNIKVIYSGHDLAWMKNLPPKKPSSLLRIAYIGQIIPIKGVHILLSAFCAVDFENQAELLIFGDSNKDRMYFQRLEETSVGHESVVKFNGAFSHEHLGIILSGIDVLVVPSLWYENNPRVIQEAYASKTPVIASNVGGISEFVKDEVNGLLFERGDVDDLAGQLRRFIDEPGLLETLKTGIPNVKNIDEEVHELEQIYQELFQSSMKSTFMEKNKYE